MLLWDKCLNCTEIHSEIVVVYSKHVISLLAILKWCGQFENSCINIINDYHPGPPVTSINAETVAFVEQFFQNNRRIKIREIFSM